MTIARQRSAALMAAAATLLWLVPGEAPALPSPLFVIERQIQKPNILVLLDTSGSMKDIPGEKDIDNHEAGIDCDEGDQCRQVGRPGRCFVSGTGNAGAGFKRDWSSCDSHLDCLRGWCKDMQPGRFCNTTADCVSPGTCINNVCSNSGGRSCSTDADCPAGVPCTVPPWDMCVFTDTDIDGDGQLADKIRMCRSSMSWCRNDADCTQVPGDKCGPATSRLIIAKRVLKNVITQNLAVANFGFMTFNQSGFFPYYETTSAPVTQTRTVYLPRRLLERATTTSGGTTPCFTLAGGPTSTCFWNGIAYSLGATNNSVYRIYDGSDDYSYISTSWSGSLFRNVTKDGQARTGYYVGSWYTYSIQTASTNTTLRRFPNYVGKTRYDSVAGKNYTYWEPWTDVNNQNNVYGDDKWGPLWAGDCGPGCSDKCGGHWWPYDAANGAGVPFMDTARDLNTPTALANARLVADQITKLLEKAAFGGLSAEGGTPTGCSLKNEGTGANERWSAFHYLKKVKEENIANGANCRPNYVIFVTDGKPNAPGDTDCADPRCEAADPVAAGCPCRAVRSAWALYNERDASGNKVVGAKVYVIGFSASVATGFERKTMDNMARAGGTGQAYLATQEEELTRAIQRAIYDAARGSYSTSPATASSGVQKAPTLVEGGNLLLDARVDFPEWRGHLVAYDVSGSSPQVAWDAYTVNFDPAVIGTLWKQRNVWTSNGTTMIKVQVDASGNVTNATDLFNAGLGASAAEAALIARWMLGDPAMGNPAVLGAMVNSTPIDIGPPGWSRYPGGDTFFNAHKNRPYLTYVGASDGMLHAFFTKQTTIGARTYRAGEEAFAYIPQDMLPVISRLFAQGGQLPDPRDHVYGLASSPKAKNVCTANCADQATAVWRTVLVMTMGFGGSDLLALDVTSPADGSGIKSSPSTPPVQLMWNTERRNQAGTNLKTSFPDYDNHLGLTTSVPAFHHAKTSSFDDERILLGSGWGPTTSHGRSVFGIRVRNGTQVQRVSGLTATTPPAGCPTTLHRSLFADAGTARNFGGTERGQILAGYFAETWGSIWRYTLNVTDSTNGWQGTSGTLSKVHNFSGTTAATPWPCHPLHFPPTIVQLDAVDPSKSPGEVYLVQVSNSAQDPETKDFAPSRMFFRKEIFAGGTVTVDSVFRFDYSTSNPAQICGVTDSSGGCTTPIPTARPTGPPTAILKKDGDGFMLLTLWYEPTSDGCAPGKTYITIHEVTPTAVILKEGALLANEPVSNVVVVNGKITYAGESGARDITASLRTQFLLAGDSSQRGFVPGTFRQNSWSEVP